MRQIEESATAKRVFQVTGKVLSLLVKEARKVAPDNADDQRAFLRDCLLQLEEDLRYN